MNDSDLIKHIQNDIKSFYDKQKEKLRKIPNNCKRIADYIKAQKELGVFHLYKSAQDAIKYRSTGYIWERIFRLTGSQLVVWYGIIFIAIVFAFAFIYKYTDIVSGNPLLPDPDNFFNFLHFSFTTQTTLGYGDYIPHGHLPRQVIAIQITIAILLNAIGAGVVAARLVRRRAKIKFPNVLLYDQQRHELRFVIWNKHKDDLCNADCKLIVRTNMVTVDFPEPVLRSCEIKLRKNVPSYIGSGAITLVTTDSDGGMPWDVKRLSPDKVSPMSLLSLSNCQSILVVLIGNSVTSGGTIVASRKYQIKHIECGRYKRYSPVTKDGRHDKWAQYKVFGKPRLTDLSACEECRINQECFIRIRRTTKDPSCPA